MGEHEYTERPWGKYFVLQHEPTMWVKRVEVNPDTRISLQKHEKRSEHWFVVSGSGFAIVDSVEIGLKKGAFVNIPVGSVHRIGNIGNDPLIFIEVGLGEYLGEDDIIRIEDDYKRE